MKNFLQLQLLLGLFSIFPGKAQTVIFSENMGSSGAGSNPSINSFSAWQNTICPYYSYSGTGSVSANVASGTGGNNIQLDAGANRTFIISGISTLGYGSISLSYNLYNSNILSSAAGFSVEISTDGVSYTALTRPNTFWVLAGWLSETCSGTIPTTQNLYLRFTNNAPFINFRIDDVTLTGTPTASSNPTPYNGWPAAYNFSSWSASSAAGTYPPNMIFHTAAVGVSQPVINDVTASYNYANSYSLAATNTCVSRVSGQGALGFSFANYHPGSSATTGNMGEAVLALNTTCRSNIQVSWLAGTITPTTGMIYQVRAQYRIGSSGSYTNLPNATIADIRFTSTSSPISFGPITLPTACENLPIVQIRWAYYYSTAGTAGKGDEIYITNINVSSSPYPYIVPVSSQTLCHGKTTAPVTFSSTAAVTTFSWSNSNATIGLATSGSGNIAAFAPPTASAPPDKTGAITVTAAVGGCTNTSSFSITVKGPQTASTWNGSVSSDWFEHNNWSNCNCSGITSATIPAVAGPNFNPVIGGAVAANVASLTLNSGASLSVQSTQTLNVNGSWTNNGSFIAQQGNVIFSGSSAQSIGGSAPTSFFDLTLSNSSGASLAAAQSIRGSLRLNSGVLNTNNLLTLAASASGTGRIAPINSLADIINQVTVQQYAVGGSTGWALLGSPITSALAMSDWNDNFIITCATCPNGSMNGLTSIYSYSEAIAGSYSATAKYIPITSISNSIDHKKGYWVYLGTSTNTTAPIIFDVSGTVAKSSCLGCSTPVTMTVTRTNNTSTFDDGWNLLSNPLPSPISWTQLRNGNSNVDNALYVYNADLGSGSGAYASYINGVSSTTTGGIADVIPICQGFYVHATATTTLQAPESIKVSGNQAFLRTASASAKPIARLTMSRSDGYSDAATFYFEQGGTINFQTDFDAYKLVYDYNLPYIGSMAGSELTSINGLPATSTSLKIPVKAMTAAPDSFYFSLEKSDIPGNVCINLLDLYTNVTTNLVTSDYRCKLYDTTTTDRFVLSFSSNPLPASTAVTQPSCLSPQSGTITATGNNAGPWDFVWKNGSSVIRVSQNRAVADTLIAAGGAYYQVAMSTSGQCDNFAQTFTLNSMTLPAAGFSVSSSIIFLSNGGQVDFSNTSTNSDTYTWHFGDGTTSIFTHPVYSYTAAGQYQVLLLAQNSLGCIDSAYATLKVMDDVSTGLNSPASNAFSMAIYTDNEGGHMLATDLKTAQDMTLKLYDANGRLLRSQFFKAVENRLTPIDLQSFAAGIYYLNFRLETGYEKTF